MKKFFKIISAMAFSGLCIAMLGSALVSCKPDDKGIDGANYTISLDKTDEILAQRETLLVTPSFSDQKAKSLEYRWLSLNLNAATVETNADGTGTVTGVAPGTAEIKIVCVTNPRLWAIFTVEVFERTVTLDKGIEDNRPKVEKIFKGKTLAITPTFAGEGTAALSYTWTATGDGVVSVVKGANNVATVTGLQPGTSTVTITCDTDPALTASCNVEVVPYTVTLNPNGGTLRKNGELVITPEFNDTGADEFEYTWESDDEGVATVEQNADGTATITGIEEGYATISVTCDDDPTITASCTVQVEIWSVSIGASAETIEVGQTSIITPAFTPSTASTLTWEWSVSPEVSYVKNTNGTITVTGVSAGEATITVTAEEDSSITDEITITVTPALGDIFGFDKVWLDGTAVSAKTEIAATLENPDVFAWYGDLTAGTLTLPSELSSSSYFIAPKDDSATFAATTEGAVEDAKLSNDAVAWTIPAAGKYRVVINRNAKTMAVYSPAIDLQPITVNWLFGGAGEAMVTTVTQLWYYGSPRWNWGADGVSDFTQSMADPQVFVMSRAVAGDQVKFGITQSNSSYVYTGNSSGAKTAVTWDVPITMIGGSSGITNTDNNHRNSYFSIPSGTNLYVVDIRNMTLLIKKL